MKDLLEARCVVVVSSFDGFEDCWYPFSVGLKKNWPDCVWPVYLLTGKKEPHIDGLNAVTLGDDFGWASNLKRFLEQCQATYILYMQDDFWINAPVNMGRLSEYLTNMEQFGWDYLRLYPSPPPDQVLDSDARLGVCLPSGKYRVCLQAALWRKSFFMELLRDGESGWDFERNARKRLQPRGCHCLSVDWEDRQSRTSYGITYCEGTAVRKGRWTQGAIRFAEREGITLATRPHESRFEEWLNGIDGSWLSRTCAHLLIKLMQKCDHR